MLRNYGSREKNHHEIIGYNHRLDEMQAAFLRIKLRHLNGANKQKAQLAALYSKHLSPVFTIPTTESGYEDAWHIFPIRHPDRDRLKSYLKEEGIETLIHYPIPPHRQKALQGKLRETNFPISDEIHNTILSLPCSSMHSREDIHRVIQAANCFSG